MSVFYNGMLVKIKNHSDKYDGKVFEITEIHEKGVTAKPREVKIGMLGHYFYYDEMMPVFMQDAYLCLTNQGVYIAHEGNVENIPPDVVQVWNKGTELKRKWVK